MNEDAWNNNIPIDVLRSLSTCPYPVCHVALYRLSGAPVALKANDWYQHVTTLRCDLYDIFKVSSLHMINGSKTLLTSFSVYSS